MRRETKETKAQVKKSFKKAIRKEQPTEGTE